MTEMLDQLGITDTDVVRFLRQHPHFFEEHPNLLKSLHLKHDSGEAVSLIERQNHILRKENTDLIDRLNTFINVAQRNDKLFLSLQALVLDLISCQSINEISDILHSGMVERFDVDAVQLVLTDRPVAEGDNWLHAEPGTLAEHFAATIRENRNACGEFSSEARAMLFNSDTIESIALGALSDGNKNIGLIALGSHSATHFRSGTDTLFLGHLAQVVSHLLHRLS